MEPTQLATNKSLTPFGNILKQTAKSYGRVLVSLWPLILIITFTEVALAFFYVEGAARTTLLSLFGVSVLNYALRLLYVTAAILALDSLFDAKEIDTLKLLWQSIRKFFSFLWIAILTLLVIVGGLIVLVIPGLVLAVGTIFAGFIYLLEGRGGLRAIDASRQLVRGFGWKVCGYLAIVVLIAATAYYVLWYAAGFIAGELLVRFTILNLSLGGLNQSIIAILKIALLPFVVAFLFWLYKDLKRIRGMTVGEEITTNTRIFSILGLIAAAILIVLGSKGIYLGFKEALTPKTYVVNADWKEYQNTKYGFSFKYPPDTKLVFLCNPPKGQWVRPDFVHTTDEECSQISIVKESEPESDIFYIDTAGNPGKLTVLDYVKSKLSLPEEGEPAYEVKAGEPIPTTIFEKEAVVYSLEEINGEDRKGRDWYVKLSNDSILLLHYFTKDLLPEEILFTFKFSR